MELAPRRRISTFPGSTRREVRAGWVRGGDGGGGRSTAARGDCFVLEHLRSFAEHHRPDDGGQHRNRDDDGSNHASRALQSLGVGRDVVSPCRGSGFDRLFRGAVWIRSKGHLNFAV